MVQHHEVACVSKLLKLALPVLCAAAFIIALSFAALRNDSSGLDRQTFARLAKSIATDAVTTGSITLPDITGAVYQKRHEQQ